MGLFKKDKLKELEKKMQKILEDKKAVEKEQEKTKEEEKPKKGSKETSFEYVELKKMENADVLKLIGKCFIHLSGNGDKEVKDGTDKKA